MLELCNHSPHIAETSKERARYNIDIKSMFIARPLEERSNVSDLVTIQFAADYLNVSTRTIRNYIADGSLEARHIGPRMIRIDYEVIRTFGRPIHKRR